MKLGTIIIEDEPNNSERLHRLLERHCPSVEVIGQAATVEQAIALIREKSPTLIFLDIELPDGTGFDILKQCAPFSFHVIFTTAYDHYAIKAIKFGAADYLLKPVEKDELVSAVERISSSELNFSGQQNKIIREWSGSGIQKQLALPTQTGYSIVLIEDIIRCEADANYTRFFLSTGEKIMVSRTLKEYDELLSENNFCRVHHRHLINMKHAVKYSKGDGGSVTMSDHSEIEVSKRKREQFLKMLPRT